jgi:FtsH-binding integral membrane protein
MFLALGISGITAYFAGFSTTFWSYMMTETGISPLFYVVIFAPLVLAIAIQARYRKMSMMVILGLFILFSALMGLSLASIFVIYSLGTIFKVFLISAGMFGGMAILGYTTKTDLSKFGSLMYMLFIGIFIASLVNMFMKSDAMGYWISFIGIFVFTGLTAWEMQKLKYIAADPTIDANDKKKVALIGGLSLYILFVNLFLSLLRVFGGRD